MTKVARYDDTRHRIAVIALWKAVFEYPAAHNEPALAIAKKLAVADDLFLVPEADGKVVGTVMAGYDGHRGWIYSLAVDTHRRSEGIGSDLLAEAERRLAMLGCLKVNLQVMPDAASAQTFYERNGYAVEERVSMGKRLYEDDAVD